MLCTIKVKKFGKFFGGMLKKLTKNQKWAIGIIIFIVMGVGGWIFLPGGENNFSNAEITIKGDGFVGNNNVVNNYYSTCETEQGTCQNNTEILIIDLNSLSGNCPNIYAANDDSANFNEGSISLWTQLHDLHLLEDRYLVDMVNLDNETFLKIWISENKIVKFYLKDSNAQEYLSSHFLDEEISDWAFIVATWGSGEINLYVDGKRESKINLESVSFQENVSGWYFGSSHLQRNCLNGKLDEIGLWDSPLSPEDIQQLYNGGEGCSYPFINC